MLEERNKAIVRRWIEAVDTGDLAVADELFAADFIDHASAPEWATDRESFKQSVAQLRAAFSNPHYAARQMIAEGDIVVIHGTWSDTSQGDLAAKQHGDEPATLREIAIYCLIDGMIVERWSALDRVAVPQLFDTILSHRSVGV
jgi:predicted ester cyclase